MSEPDGDSIAPTAAIQQITSDLKHLLSADIRSRAKRIVTVDDAVSIINTAIENGVYTHEAGGRVLRRQPER